MTREERERYFTTLRDNEDLCLAIVSWAEEEIRKLENPKLWDKNRFEVDGQSNLKAAEKLRLLILKLTKIKDESKKTSYQ